MENFDLNKMKSIGILLLICMVFALVVGNAYNYLPENNPKTNINQEQIADDSAQDSEEKENSNEQEVSQSKSENEISSDNVKVNVKPEPLEVISDEELSAKQEIKQESKPELTIDVANKYFADKDYTKALETYKNIVEGTDNSVLKAECYEKIATIYGIMKKYGTAIAFAQKGYKLSPSASREFLLARLYYKVGEENRAQAYINNIFKRSFDE